MPFFQGTRRVLLYGPKKKGLTLLPVGPYAGLIAPSVSSLSSVNSAGNYVALGSLANPIKLNTLTFSGAGNVILNVGVTSSMYLWVDTFNCGSPSNGIIADGTNGGDASDDTCCCSIIVILGGGAGVGGSGGGGGAASQFTTTGGGNGSSGGNGANGQDEGGISSGGPGGFGFGSAVGSSFIFGNGGNSITTTGATILGGNGFGAGGSGGSVQPDTPNVGAGGGGGGGAGLISLVCRVFRPGLMVARGGTRGNPFSTGSSNVSSASGGGGGVIWVAAQKKSLAGSWSVVGINNGTNGTVKLFEIGRDGVTLTQHTTLTDMWDNT